MNGDRVILVTGATGRQGGAVARHLLEHDWRIRALTRDPSKPQAKYLQSMGANVVRGDMEEPETIRNLMRGCYGVFSVQAYWEIGYDAEVRQGKMLADLASELGVEHFVYSSVGAANLKTGIPHFESKWEIEQHIRNISLPATIFRPSFFYDNFDSSPYRESILQGKLQMPMAPDKPLQMIAVNDIGGFVALAFNKPQLFVGKSLDISGDELVMPRVAEIFSSVLGRRIQYEQLPIEEADAVSADVGSMFHWFNEKGYVANIQALRDVHPQLETFETYLRRSGWGRERQAA